MPGRYDAGKKDLFGADVRPEEATPASGGRVIVTTKKKAGPNWPTPSWEVKCGRCPRRFLVICPKEPADPICSVCFGDPRPFIPSDAKFDPFSGRYFLPVPTK